VQGECGQPADAEKTQAEAAAILEQSLTKLRFKDDQADHIRDLGQTRLALAALLRGQGRSREAADMAHRVGGPQPRQAELIFEAAQEIVRCADQLASGEGDAELDAPQRKIAVDTLLDHAAHWLALALVLDEKLTASAEEDPLTARLKDHPHVTAVAEAHAFAQGLKPENAAVETTPGSAGVLAGKNAVFAVELVNNSDVPLDSAAREELTNELVVGQCYLDPISGLAKEAGLDRRNKEGSRYTDGGGTIAYYARGLAARERRKITMQILSKDLPPGEYRYWFSIKQRDGKLVAEASASFVIVPAKS
jgi:hypothetical protein